MGVVRAGLIEKVAAAASTTAYPATGIGRGVFTRDLSWAKARDNNAPTTLSFDNAAGATGENTGTAKTGGLLYVCYQYFCQWDLSALAGKGIRSAVLSMVQIGFGSATQPELEARVYDWGAAVDLSDFRSKAQLAALPLLGRLNTAAEVADTRYDFTMDATAQASVQAAVGGVLGLVLCGRNQTDDVAPTVDESVNNYTADSTPQATRAPRLVLTTLA